MRTYLEIGANDLSIKYAGRDDWRGLNINPNVETQISDYQQISQYICTQHVDLLKINATNLPLLEPILKINPPTTHPTHIILESTEHLEIVGEKLIGLGYRYKGRRGNNVQYSMPSVLIFCEDGWSTGSIAKDLKHVSRRWHVDLFNWNKYPDNFEKIVSEYDAIASFILLTPHIWPTLAPYGVVCSGVVEFNMLERRDWYVIGGCFGSVSKEAYYALTKVQQTKSVYYTPATVRMSRFQYRPDRPINTLGWCGTPQSIKNFGEDAKRYFMFEEIAKATGLKTHVSYKDFTYDTMQNFYDSVDILICTSINEGGPLPLFEAIACGVPVISTDVGIAKEAKFIDKFETVQQATDLISKLGNEQYRKEYVKKQYAQCSAMSMERLIPHWEEFFEACAKTNTSTVSMLVWPKS